MLAHTNLADYYTMTYQLVQHHKYSLSDLEDMMPFEKDIYVSMLRMEIDEENKRNRNANV